MKALQLIKSSLTLSLESHQVLTDLSTAWGRWLMQLSIVDDFQWWATRFFLFNFLFQTLLILLFCLFKVEINGTLARFLVEELDLASRFSSNSSILVFFQQGVRRTPNEITIVDHFECRLYKKAKRDRLGLDGVIFVIDPIFYFSFRVICLHVVEQHEN